MGYVPDLHKIWVGTSDQQLMALSNEFPGFYRYALLCRVFFSILTREPLQYSIFSHFIFLL
jgi:hypothetical protein